MTPVLSLSTGLGSQHKAWSRLKIAAGKCRNAGQQLHYGLSNCGTRITTSMPTTVYLARGLNKKKLKLIYIYIYIYIYNLKVSKT